MKRFGISPSEKFNTLYKTILSKTHNAENNLTLIRNSLSETAATVCGAYLCDYAVFKDIYQLKARSAKRNNETIYLCLFTIASDTSKRGDKLSVETMNKAMNILNNCIRSSLRSSDVYSRYSVSQYILMLPVSSYENGCMVLKRIMHSFILASKYLPITCTYKLLPISVL